MAAGLVFLGVSQVKGLGKKVSWAVFFLLFAVFLAGFLFKPPIWVTNALILLGAVGLGGVLALFLGKKANIIAFLVTASIVDIVSFSGGLTAKISADYASGASDLLYHLAIFVPRGGEVRPLLGIGDLIIMGALNSAFLGMGTRKILAFAVPLLGLFLALVVGLLVGGVFGIPFIALVVIVFLLSKNFPKH